MYLLFFKIYLLLFFLILKSLILTCIPKHEPPSHLPPHNISLGHNYILNFVRTWIIYNFFLHSPPLFQKPTTSYKDIRNIQGECLLRQTVK